MDEFIAGGKSIAGDWNTYVQGLDHPGLPQYLQITAKYAGQPFNTSYFKPNQKSTHYFENLK